MAKQIIISQIHILQALKKLVKHLKFSKAKPKQVAQVHDAALDAMSLKCKDATKKRTKTKKICKDKNKLFVEGSVQVKENKKHSQQSLYLLRM